MSPIQKLECLNYIEKLINQFEIDNSDEIIMYFKNNELVGFCFEEYMAGWTIDGIDPLGKDCDLRKSTLSTIIDILQN